jgi:heat shock protein HspQ
MILAARDNRTVCLKLSIQSDTTLILASSYKIGHTVRLSLHARIIVVVDLLPSFWATHGYKTAIELVLA